MPTTNLGIENTFVAGSTLPATWCNTVANAVDAALRAGGSSVSVAGSGDVTLTVAQYDATLLVLTGTLTGARGVVLPLTAGRFWLIRNSTSGSYSLTVKGSSGTGVVVAQGDTVLVYTDGTNFYAGTVDLARLEDALPYPTIAVGAEAANVIQVTIQLRDWAGVALAQSLGIEAWLVDSNSLTAALTATAPSGGWAAGVGRLLHAYTASKHAKWISDSAGVVRIDITETGARTWYLVVQTGARLTISGAVAFT